MIKIKDLFDLAKELSNQLMFMIDNYEEMVIDDTIPDKTLDDIIDEIKIENDQTPDPEPEPDPNQTDDTTEPTDEPSDDPEPNPQTDDTTEPTDEPSDDSESDPQTDDDPEPEGPLDRLINLANVTIVEINALKRNAELDNILDCDCSETSNTSVVDTCCRLYSALSELYCVIDGINRVFYDDNLNVNNRSKFIIRSYAALSKFTSLVIKIYNTIGSKKYLIAVNGPINDDYNHWINVESISYLTSIDLWKNLNDTIYLNLIDEAVQLDLKYAALLKKLVISEFKGFDTYYEELINFIKEVYDMMGYYETYYVKDATDDAFYDPSVLVKANTISMVTHVNIPFTPEEETSSETP